MRLRLILLLLLVLAGAPAAPTQTFPAAAARFREALGGDDPAALRAAVTALGATGEAQVLEVLAGPLRDWCYQAEVARKERAALAAARARLQADLKGGDEERRRAAELRGPQLEARWRRVTARLKEMESLRAAAVAALARVGTLRGGECLRGLERRAEAAREWFLRLAYVEAVGRVDRREVVAWLLQCLARTEKALLEARARRDRAEGKLRRVLGRFARRPGPAEEQRLLRAQAAVSRYADLLYGARRILEAGLQGLGRRLAGLTGGARDEAVAAALRALRRVRSLEVESPFLLALAALHHPAVGTALQEGLRRARGPLRRVAYLDALGRQGDPAALPLLVAALEDPAWPVRAAAVAALAALRDARAVPPLIARLRAEEGRLGEDVEAALVALTGQRLGFRPEAWERWWAAHRGTFRVGPGGRVLAAAATAGAGFYGIATRSRRLVYVIDVSGSMAEEAAGGDTKYARACQELLQAVGALPRGAVFNVIFYATRVRRWQPRMVSVGLAVRERLRRTLAEVRPAGGTNAYGALMEALALAGIGAQDRHYPAAVDTIFFLSDGHPTVGALLDPERILAEVKARNRLGRVRIHTIGVGKDHNVAFLRRLAAENGGRYVAR